MTIALSERGRSYLERARALGPLLDASAAEIEESRDIPAPVFERLVADDMFRMLLPEAYGGAAIEPMALVQVMEEIGRHDASTAWCLGQNNVSTLVAAYMEPSLARAVFDGPRAIVAWGPGPASARAVDGGYRLTGRFDFASGSRHATWMGAHVPVTEADGSRRLAADGSPGVFTLLFPKDSVRIEDTWHVLGLKGTGSDTYHLDDLFVPESHAIPRSRTVKPRVQGKLNVFTQSPLYASSFAGIALGIARATLDAFVASVAGSTPRGAKKTRGDNNVVQATVGLGEARVRSARMFLLGTLEQVWGTIEPGDQLTQEQYVALRMATTWAIQQARETVSQLYVGAGAMAIFASRPFERRFRDIHTLSQQIQGHAAHFETIGHVLLGGEPDRPLFTF
jgi:indole-3-acetate monooxygenase